MLLLRDAVRLSLDLELGACWTLASIVALATLFLGSVLVDLFKIEAGAFLVGAGLIVVVFAVRMVISDPITHAASYEAVGSPMQTAIYPLAVPLLVTPPAIGALSALGIDSAISDTELLGVAVMVLLVMAFNLSVFLLVARTEDAVHSGVWDVGGRILGVFLTAFGVTIIIDGIRLIYI